MINKSLTLVIGSVYLVFQIAVIEGYYHPPLNAAEITRVLANWMPWIAGIARSIGENNEGGVAMAFVLAIAHLPMLLLGFFTALIASLLHGRSMRDLSIAKTISIAASSIALLIFLTVVTYWLIPLSGVLRMSRPILACLVPTLMGILAGILFRISKQLVRG